ncbi:MAG: hypothetical protein HYU63_04190 [Armatimonadetes bacterium]|nr:hypothetical protein [Armatimonadota bacterium]
MSETIIAICPKCKSKNRILMEKAANSQTVCGKCKNNIYPEMPGYPIEATDLNFENNVVRAGVITLVDFYSNHCSPCKTMEPIIKQLAYDLAGKSRIDLALI